MKSCDCMDEETCQNLTRKTAKKKPSEKQTKKGPTNCISAIG